jgi:hypothetical protein
MTGFFNGHTDSEPNKEDADFIVTVIFRRFGSYLSAIFERIDRRYFFSRYPLFSFALWPLIGREQKLVCVLLGTKKYSLVCRKLHIY